MSFLADQLIGEARRRQVRLWVDSTGRLQFAGDAPALDDRFVMLLRTQAQPIAAKIGVGRQDRWFRRLTDHGDDGNALLYLIPAAGAGPNSYRPWSAEAPAGLRIEAVLTPGREERFAEAPFTDVAALADRIAERILGHADRPFGIFGHSTGALVAREVTRRLVGSTTGQRALFVAGALPPHMVDEPGPEPSEEELLGYLNAWQGTPPELLADPAFLRTFLPTLRADLRLFHSCRRTVSPAERVAVPMTAFGGLQDETAPPGHCEAWRPWVTGRFSVRMVEGGHFFPVTAAPEVLAEVSRELGVPAG
ncbi:thioesterase II family protein [Streptomyces sp. NPDC058279]|uniref:thioesterase II family protein n=1 Tax=Streptomyces sp. NPDC058279 TaxID=3346418 RepID=UPI0036E8A36D